MSSAAKERVLLESMDAYLALFGTNDRNLPMIENELDVRLMPRGEELLIEGENAPMAAAVVEKLLELHQRKAQVDRTTLRYALSLVKAGQLDKLDDIAFETVAVTFRGRP
ncbi:MAG: hypothetical protein RSG96_06430, partial [Clostridia bacterium]